MSLNRRDFLNLSAAAAVVAATGPGLRLIELARARSPEEAASSLRIPACAEACKKHGNEAILFGDLKDPGSEICRRLAARTSTQLRPELNLNTGVRYQGL